MDSKSAQAIIEKFEEIRLQGNISSLKDWMADNIVYSANGNPEDESKIMAAIEHIQQEHNERSLELARFYTDGNTVIWFGKYYATDNETGRRFYIPFCKSLTIEEGKIIAYHVINNYNNLIEVLNLDEEDE